MHIIATGQQHMVLVWEYKIEMCFRNVNVAMFLNHENHRPPPPAGVEFLHQLSGGQVGKEIRDKIMDTPFQEDFEEELKAL